MTDLVIVSEWDVDSFHKRVLELEAQGYMARRDSYRIMAEMNPETGQVLHLYTIELRREDSKSPGSGEKAHPVG
jgi:hypothetical protein